MVRRTAGAALILVALAGCQDPRATGPAERAPAEASARSYEPDYWKGRHPVRISVGYPSEYIPKMTICAQHLTNRRETCINLGANAQNFEVVMHLEPGEYVFHARSIEGYTGTVWSTNTYNPDGTVNAGVTRAQTLRLPAERNRLIALDFYHALGERVKGD
jgi:hypothetical protein